MLDLKSINNSFDRLYNINDTHLNESKVLSAKSNNLKFNIENELDKRKEAFNFLLENRYDVEDHYINRFNFDLAVIKRMLKEDIEKLDFTNESEVNKFFDDLDFRIKHAKDYIGLPG